MQILILIASLVMLAFVGAILLVLRGYLTGSRVHDDTLQIAEVGWRDYRPLDRLLDPSDFEFLRSRGVAEARIQKLREERRTIYRRCLRNLAHDFDLVHRSVNMVLIQSEVDRPELAAELAKQKVRFYRNLMKAEFRLSLNALGFDRMPAIDLLAPLEALQAHLQQVAVSGAAA